jgi:antirestriction protein ArdC
MAKYNKGSKASKGKNENGVKAELEMIEKGIEELLASGKWAEFLKFQSAFHNYSFGNTMLIMCQCPTASRVTGYNTWKKLGRQVQKGQKAIKILAPMMFKAEKEEENDKGEKEKKEVSYMRFKSVSVFDVSQTDGEELPSLVNKLEGETELYKRISDIVPIPVEEEVIEGGANGYYHLVDKRIAIKHDNSEMQKLKTVIHEWGHHILHSKESKEKVSNDVMELEAESVAFIVCHRLGIDTSDYSFGYLTGWGQGKEASAKIKASGERIQKASNEILETIDKNIKVDEKETVMA